MFIHERVRSKAGYLAMAIGCLLLGGSTTALAQGQVQPARGAKPAGTPFTEAVVQAKRSGRPLIVFGTAPSCVRCQALKQGLATQPELKLLMTQYVSAEVPFAGREFQAIFKEIYRKDDKYRQAIGSPSVFIFTAQGDTVYAGPNRESGIAADAEFQKLLISGIEKNGGVRRPLDEGQLTLAASLPADLAKARKLAAAGQTSAAAAVIAKYVQPETAAEDEVAALVKLTGLPIAKSKAEEQLAALAEELAAKPTVQPAAERVWKSKDGKFSVTASLRRFDGVTAHLQTSEGKAIAVPLSALSPEDQQFLKTTASGN